MTHSACPFCNPDAGAIFLETNKIMGLWDAFPVSPGHALLVTKRHVADWFSATAIEQRELLAAIPKARDAITSEHCPAGFNVGFNVGEAAGQTVPHLHIHVIPRYPGDVPDPTGGVRHVIPGKANYLMSGDGSEYEARPLVRGGQSDPFMRRLRTDLEHCHTVDIAVAFIYEAGLDLIEDYLKDILRRDGRIRILTGDYRDVTDPKALHRLVDFRDSETRGSVELRIFECGEDSFHPKAYVLATKTGQSLAYVGSSNLSRMALEVGVEWNYRVSGETDPVGHQDIRDAFEELFLHPKTRTLNHQWIEDYRLRRTEPEAQSKVAIEAPREEPPEVPTPHSIQKEALAALEETRAAGNGAGLVVLATGLGKTWLSAFDSDRPEFKRILFVAHREEILDQAMRTFRKIRPTAHLGRFDGRAKDPNADVLFASVQALSRVANLRRFTRTSFDYVVIDEFHHAAARTYRKLIDYFDPKFLLGLTATPERTDGGDLLALCQENLVYRCDLAAGIGRELLSPFRYFGVPDLVDYSNIPWRSSRFDETELSNALATQARAENALEQYRLRGGERALGFCCSVRHADFMAVFFRDRGVRAVAVHSGDTSAPRARALDDLREGKLDMIFAVDIFNEGVDIPTVDTILMLRPTESRILWFQQFGRGLRKVAGKDHLTVVDYIGNHRTFLLKPQCILDVGNTDHDLSKALAGVQAGTLELPPGCEVTYDLEAINILLGLLRTPKKAEALTGYYKDYLQRHGTRPTALQAFHDGYNPASARKRHGSWLGFVEGMGGLAPEEMEALEEHRQLLESLDTTHMTKSFKMLLLLAMMNEDAFPGEIRADLLTSAFARLAKRSEIYRSEVICSLEDASELTEYLKRNPIAAWTGGRSTGGRRLFRYEDDVFEYTVPCAERLREALRELVRELCDWRLAQHILKRHHVIADDPDEFRCRLSHSSGKPIIRLPDRALADGLPSGWTPVAVAGERYEANFVRVAVNVARHPGEAGNVLPELLREMFGPDAGLPGTRHEVVLGRSETGWDIRRAGEDSAPLSLDLGGRYLRKDVPGLFGLRFSRGSWHQGFVKTEKDLFLLVTLEKAGFQESHQYSDRFLGPDRFLWQSQNRQSRTIPSGVILRDHEEKGFAVHLFVRRAKTLGGASAPFVYCGPVRFVEWKGDKPITVTWRLDTPLPGELRREFGVE